MKKGLYEKELHLNTEDIYLNINNNKEIINRNNERKSTKDDENNMMIDEAIQYCSSPKFGLVSIHASRNKKYNKFIQLTEYRNDIPNTVSMIVRPIKTIIEVEEEKAENNDSSNYNISDNVNTKERKIEINSFLKQSSKENKLTNPLSCLSNIDIKKIKKEKYAVFNEIDIKRVEKPKKFLKKYEKKKNRKNKKSR